MTDPAPHARVAVPAPLPDALIYEVPAAFDASVRAGVRVRVPLGRRKVVGVVVGRTENAPEGVELRPLEAVLDAEPVLPEELMELAGFVADYYLAPPGEVFRSMLPGHLPPWGDRKVWLTSAGAIAPPRNEAEAAVVEVLTEAGRLSLSDLQRSLGRSDLPGVIDRLMADGRLASGDSRRSGGVRYQTAVELPPGDPERQLEAAGRSKEGRSVIELLAALGRPALVSEITDRVGCGDGVVRRLVRLGVLRRFTQVERVSLARHRLEETGEPPDDIVLRPDQRRAVEALTGALESDDFHGFLLTGVTGSGKTEVYLRAADRALEQGRSVVLLVPEIALVPALARELRRRFGRELAILHSGLSAGERSQEWERIRLGEARVVLGPRSAVFAPVADLGLIVVDEEQDGSYKQDSTPRYHGRDVALVRGRSSGATVVAVSATPSLESRYNVETGKLTGLELTERAGGGELPESVLVDLRREAVRHRPGEVHFSDTLREELDAAFAAGDQVILLRNRRGYSPLLLCRACGEDHRCQDCGLPRTLHRREGRLLCHYCGSKQPVPRRCHVCGEEALEPIGAGTERVEETFRELYPEVAVGVLDRDTARQPGGLAAILERFSRGETRVLIGTQMVAKGHHFPRVALAAVLSADTYLGFPDFRAVEKTYSLLVQLAGRAGRGERPGRVVIQTFHPQHYAVRAAMNHDDDSFVEEEMRFRRIFHYPPFTRMVQLLVRDKNRGRAETAMRDLARAVHAHPLAGEVRITGPAPAPLERLKGRWRFQLLVRSPSARRLKELLGAVLPDKPGVDLVVDVDPLDLM
jgi:primosomal protein N' (replication factor Y)